MHWVMKKIASSLTYQDARGSIETIFGGQSWKEVNKFVSEKGAIRGNHYHKDTMELLFILSGKIKITIKNVHTQHIQQVMLCENEGMLIEPFELHTVEVLEKTEWLGLLSKEYDKDHPDVFKESEHGSRG